MPATLLAQFQSQPVTEAVVGTPYVYSVSAGGQGNVVITAPQGLPAWLTLTGSGSGTAVLTGTPLEADTEWPVLLQAEDDVCRVFTILCARQSFTITVAGVVANAPPVVVPPGIGNQVATIGEPFGLDLTPAFSDPDGDPLSYAAVGLPSGFLVDAATIKGTAVSAEGSPHTVEVTASDGRGGTVTLTFLLTIEAANAPPVVATPPLGDRSFIVGDAIAIDLVPGFADADGDPLTFTTVGLPPWLMLSGTTIVGTAQTTDGSPHAIEVTANDGRGGTATSGFLLTIVAANVPPTVATPPLEDRTFTVGDPIAIDLAPGFTDPDGDPLTFTVRGLPPWLVLSGTTIVGTALTTAGSPHRIGIDATDGRGGIVVDEILITIRPQATADIAISALEATPMPALRGATITWRIDIENRGPEPGGNTMLNLEFSGIALAFQAHNCSATPAGAGQSLACPVNGLPTGTTSSVTIQATAAQHGDVWMAAALTAPALPIDPEPANDRAAAAVNVGEAIVTASAQHIAGASVVAIEAAEFDGAGGTDLVAATADGRLLLSRRGESPAGLAAELEQPGDFRTGLMAAETLLTAALARALALADLDGDGLPDLAYAAGPGAASAVYRNAGDGQIVRLASLGTAAADDRAIVARDINGDGLVDLVVAGDSVRGFLHSGNPATFTERLIGPAAGAVTGLDVIQLVGSPLPDVVVAYADSPVVVHENLGGGSFRAAGSLGAGATSLASGDFNRDGLEDLLVARAATGEGAAPARVVYLGSGSGTLPVAAELGASAANAIAVLDVGADGFADFFSINATGAHQLYSGTGNGTFSLNGWLLASPNRLAAASGAFSRDDRADLVVAGTDGISVWFDDGRGRFGHGDLEPPVITLTGASDLSIEVGGSYTDPGAVATDNLDGQIAPTVDNPVDPLTIGTYTVSYEAVDSAGNAAPAVTRTVRVVPRAAAGSSGGGGGGGGGGGAADLSMLAALLAALAICTRRRRES